MHLMCSIRKSDEQMTDEFDWVLKTLKNWIIPETAITEDITKKGETKGVRHEVASDADAAGGPSVAAARKSSLAALPISPDV
jgi:hypothetical protein